jgi:hypothetical protein
MKKIIFILLATCTLAMFLSVQMDVKTESKENREVRTGTQVKLSFTNGDEVIGSQVPFQVILY